jgi:hypothetical protein
MVRRLLPGALAALIVAALGAGCAGQTRFERRQLRPGDSLPAEFTGADRSNVLLVWAFRPDQLLRCQNPAGPLRHVQRAFAPQVRIVALSVGGDDGLADGFLRRERVPAQHRVISEAQAWRMLGGTSLPALLVVKDGEVESVLSGAQWKDSNANSVHRLEELVRRALAAGHRPA